MTPIRRNILLNPGPATTTNTVKFAQVVPDICPREEEFGLLMEEVSSELTRFVTDEDGYTTVLFGGSGTAAVESILSSAIGDDTVLIINNGAYGKRMCEIAEAYGLHYLEFPSPPDLPIDMIALESIVGSHAISNLAVVHLETTTGLLNDITSIGNLCRRHNIDFIVDAMSSFGAVPIRMADMNISFLAASSNKCLQGMPGVCFVVANNEKVTALKDRKPRNYYLNLYEQHRHFVETRQMRFTPPVQTFYALQQAILELKQEGVIERYERYKKSWETIVDGITQLGLTFIVSKEHHSKIVTSIVEPDCSGYDFQEMHDYLYDQGFTIYPGKLDNRKTFRIANIGDVSHEDMTAFLKSLENYLRTIDFFRKADE
ncbi:2-aminoethylphosphonate aminotransferase [Paenibacillus terrigena]|uniref:2-aminoethylphosphonate aminotransferase n=1 Tax=Paenibacillus terrigena TaxID=369333 RepID=UPI00035C6E6E|nr:2-aminoethylphosphonate--pyruvate transaminase [Paenibacillus terrigena]